MVAEEVITCPLCRSVDSFPVRSIDGKRLIEAWDQIFDISAQFQDLSSVDLFKCNRCHLQFFLPDNLAGPQELYARLEKFQWYYIPGKWEYDIAIDNLRRGQSVLEIGCGYGDFIERGQAEGMMMAGIELNESAIREGKKRGLSILALTLEEAALRFPGHYDAVCSFQVLEHVHNPAEFLKWSCSLIKPKGKLILGLPNSDSFLKYQFNILDMPPHHMTRWSTKTLSYLPSLFPLRLKERKVEPLAEYHLEGYIDAYCSALSKYRIIRPLCRSRIKRGLAKFIRRTGMRKLLTGHSMCVSYEKL